MEIPINLVYCEDGVITYSNEIFKTTITSLYPQYSENYLHDKKIEEVFLFEDSPDKSKYTLIKLGNFRLYAKTTLINNLIVVDCSVNDFIDSRYFIHSTLTPLTNIIELMKMLDRTQMTSKQKEYTGIIKRNNFELTKNINDITSYLNYLTKGIVITKEVVRLKTKLHDVMQILFNIDKMPINIILNDNDIVLSDYSVVFDMLYHLFFILKKETNTVIDVYYDTGQRRLKFRSGDFKGYHAEVIRNYNFSGYVYNDTLDVAIFKLILKLTEMELHYNDQEYSLMFV